MFEGLREEVKQAYLHLKSAKNDTGQDKVAYAKAAVALLEKLVKMEALITNVEMVGNFQRAMIDILDEVCSPSQRTEVMRRVQSYGLLSPEPTAAQIEDLNLDDSSL